MYGHLLRFLMKVSSRQLRQTWKYSLSDPAASQSECLRTILRNNSDCEYGCNYGFDKIRDAEEFADILPIVNFSDISEQIERCKAGESKVLVSADIEMFTVTSGTTGKAKYLPVTRAMNLEQHLSHRLWMAKLVADHPKVANHYLYTSFSPAIEGFTTGGIPYGSATGKSYQNQPLPVRIRHALPYQAALIKNYNARHYCTLVFALARNLSCATSANPSTLYLLARRLKELSAPLLEDLQKSARDGRGAFDNCPGLETKEKGELAALLKVSAKRRRQLKEIVRADGFFTPRAVWPDLAAICTWHGGNAPFYLSRLQDSWGNTPRRCLGLRASEGMFSIPVADSTSEGVLATLGHFLEFVPESETVTPQSSTLCAHQLEKGKRYNLIITTSGGLYRYNIGDIVEVTAFKEQTPVIAFLHKAGKVLSITGEKVTEEQVVAAVTAITKNQPVNGFSVTLKLEDTPFYLLAVEFDVCENAKERSREIAFGFEQELSRQNLEYKQKRQSGRLAPVEVLLLPQGTYAAFRQRLIEAGRPESQIKPPHLLSGFRQLQSLLLPDLKGNY